MKFGDRLLSSQHPPWSGKYINYYRLKKLLNPLFDLQPSLGDGGAGGGSNVSLGAVREQPVNNNNNNDGDDPPALQYNTSHGSISTLGIHHDLHPEDDEHDGPATVTTSHQFQRELNYEIQKTLLFLLKSMGELASDLSALAAQRRIASQNVRTLLEEREIMDGEHLRHVMQNQLQDLYGLRMDYLVRVGSKLLLLLHFLELNVEAIVKIVKKHDKNLSRWEETHRKKGDGDGAQRYVRLRREYLPRFAANSRDPNVRCLFLAATDAGDCSSVGDVGHLRLPSTKNGSYDLDGKFGGWDALQWNLETALRELHGWQADLQDAFRTDGEADVPQQQPHDFTPITSGSKSFSDIPLAGRHGMASPIKKLLSSSSSFLGMTEIGRKGNQSKTMETDDDDNRAAFFEPVIYQIQSSRQRLGQMHHRYIRMVYAHEMLHLVDEKGLHDREDEDYLLRRREDTLGSMDKLEILRSGSFVTAAGSERDAAEGAAQAETWMRKAYPTVSGLSKFLNLASAGLYMCNYNIVAPTSGLYAQLLGFDPANAGIIIGCTPAAVILSSVLYSWWSSYSYKRAIIFASFCCMAGNIVYALALPFDSLGMVLVGRMLTGFGSARVINRRYIADYYSIEQRTSGMADFVSASAFGMALGPGLAASLSIIAPSGTVRDSATNAVWTIETAPGYIMFVLWAIYLVCNVLFFEEPERIGHSATAAEPSKGTSSSKGKPTGGGGSSDAIASENTPFMNDPNGGAISADEVKSAQPFWSMFRSCGNIPVLISLALLVLLKSVIEGVSSSAPTLSRYYFGWGVHLSGIYLAALASFVLPTNFMVAYISRRFDDRELILGALAAMLVGILGFLVYSENGEHYSEARFIFFGIVAFVSCNALEGPTMGLLSKTIPKSLARGILNAGLLATEAGTLGRVVGDFWLSSAAFMGLNEMLNRTFEPMCAMVGVAIVATLWSWPHLQPRFDDEDDD